MDPLLITAVAFVAITLLVGALALSLRAAWLESARSIQRRLGGEAPGEWPVFVPRRQLPASGGIRGRMDRWFTRLLDESGTELTMSTLTLCMLMVGLLCGGPLFLWRNQWMLGLLGLGAGMLAVVAYLMVVRFRRRELMQEQLAESIDLLARAVRAGETIEQALELSGRQISQPLGRELEGCADHLSLGLSIDAAMRVLSRRVPVTEMQILAVTLNVQRRAGGNLPDTLEGLARVLRDRLNYVRQFRAATAGMRLGTLVIVTATLLAAVYMLVWQPDYISTPLWEHNRGRVLLVVAFVLQATGLFWIYRLMRPEY